jgi:hypothetical protein
MAFLFELYVIISTYIFRVATKDMTYAKQLRDYENAVLQKRLEELADDEIEALMQEIELEENAEAVLMGKKPKLSPLSGGSDKAEAQ